MGEVRDREVDPAGERRGQARPPRTLVDGEAAGTSGAGEGGLVQVDAVHVRVGQQHGQRRGQRAGAAAEVDDHAGIGAQGDGGGEDRLGPAPGHEDAGRERHPDRPERRPADDLLERTPRRAVGDGAGRARRGRRTSPRSPRPRPRRRRSRRRAGRARPPRWVTGTGWQDPPHARDGYDVEALRAHFPSLAGGTAYFDGPGGTQTPDVVGEAMRRAITQPLSNRGRLTPAERNADDTVLAARTALADLVGGAPEGVVFGRSMTQLTFDISRAMAKTWEPGDEIVVTKLDHDANVRPWVIAAENSGATVRWAEFDPATGELDPSAITSLLTEDTRLVAVTAASNLIGTRPDLPAIAAGGARGGRAAVRRRRAPHRARRDRRGRAGRGLLRVLALQVPRPALRRRGAAPELLADAAPRQAGARDRRRCPSGSSSARCPTS